MAFAAVDPKKAEYLRDQKAREKALQEREEVFKRIALEESERLEAEQKRIKREIWACYRPDKTIVNGVEAEGYSPKQIALAGRMIQAGNTCKRLTESDRTLDEYLGTSNGGRRRGKLYRCLKA